MTAYTSIRMERIGRYQPVYQIVAEKEILGQSSRMLLSFLLFEEPRQLWLVSTLYSQTGGTQLKLNSDYTPNLKPKKFSHHQCEMRPFGIPSIPETLVNVRNPVLSGTTQGFGLQTANKAEDDAR